MTEAAPVIDLPLVRQLIDAQFPDWTGLPLHALEAEGTDNAIFRLGPSLCVRLPKVSWASQTAQRETALLPLFGGLALDAPVPRGLGEPGHGYPWHWSVLGWIEGDVVGLDPVPQPEISAARLAEFILAIRAVPVDERFLSGASNSYRGVRLDAREAFFTAAVDELADEFDADALRRIWQLCLDAHEDDTSAVWLHGDFHGGNLLKRDGQLSAVIDWGLAGVGDGACDLSAAWTLFDGESRNVFRQILEPGEAEWLRGAGWALSIGCIAMAHYRRTASPLSPMSRRTISEILAAF